MDKNIEERLIEILNKYVNEDVVTVQNGFMQAKYLIKNFSYNIEEDILSCISSDTTYISVNINMINNITYKDNELGMYLDNDTIIKYKKLG